MPTPSRIFVALIGFTVANGSMALAQGELRADPAPINASADNPGSLADVEARYRRGLAEIRRLQELARERGDEQRWNQLSDLERSLNARYESHMAELRRRLGDEAFNQQRDAIARSDERRRRTGQKPRPDAGVVRPDRAHPADVNQDGLVDETERRAWSGRANSADDARSRSLPSPAADTNHDGVIDQAEREAWERRGRGTTNQPRAEEQRRREAQPQDRPTDRKASPSDRGAQKPTRSRPETKPPPKRPSNPPPPRQPSPPKRDPTGKPSRGAAALDVVHGT
jgi:hypothetical protein